MKVTPPVLPPPPPPERRKSPLTLSELRPGDVLCVRRDMTLTYEVVTSNHLYPDGSICLTWMDLDEEEQMNISCGGSHSFTAPDGTTVCVPGAETAPSSSATATPAPSGDVPLLGDLKPGDTLYRGDLRGAETLILRESFSRISFGIAQTSVTGESDIYETVTLPATALSSPVCSDGGKTYSTSPTLLRTALLESFREAESGIRKEMDDLRERLRELRKNRDETMKSFRKMSRRPE